MVRASLVERLGSAKQSRCLNDAHASGRCGAGSTPSRSVASWASRRCSHIIPSGASVWASPTCRYCDGRSEAVRNQPLVGAVDRSLGEGGHEAGPDDARLAGATRADQRDESLTATEVAEQLGDERVASEERPGVVGTEWAQPLERVHDRPRSVEQALRRRQPRLDPLVVEEDLFFEAQQPR